MSDDHSMDGTEHLLKAIFHGIFFFGIPLLPVVATAVFVWAVVTQQGLQSILGAVMGFVTGIISFAGLPDFERQMRRHWYIYTGKDRNGGER